MTMIERTIDRVQDSLKLGNGPESPFGLCDLPPEALLSTQAG